MLKPAIGAEDRRGVTRVEETREHERRGRNSVLGSQSPVSNDPL